MFRVFFLKISCYRSTPKNPYVTSLTDFAQRHRHRNHPWWWIVCNDGIVFSRDAVVRGNSSCPYHCEAKIGGSGLWAVKNTLQSAIFTGDKRRWYIKLNIYATWGPIWLPIEASCGWLPRARSIIFGCAGCVKWSRFLPKGYYLLPCFCQFFYSW
jgi:hypothetical protein